jgi:ferredoxin--NADP+ reductase
VIGTNKPDAAETADAILADAAAGVLLDPPANSADLVANLLALRQPELVTWDRWQKIAAAEAAAGKAAGLPRAKLTTVPDLVAAALATA